MTFSNYIILTDNLPCHWSKCINSNVIAFENNSFRKDTKQWALNKIKGPVNTKHAFPTIIYLFKLNDRNTRKMSTICFKLPMKLAIPMTSFWSLYC